MATDLTALVGTILSGRYRLEKPIGEGGMGAVFEATQLSLGRRVAVKVVKPSLSGSMDADDVARRFERETEIIASLNHPHIVQVVDGGRADDGTLFLAMELIEGKSVRALVRQNGSIELGLALAIAEDVASALVAAHDHGVIHRDLKAENVMLVRAAGKTELAKVLDFGVAKVTSRTEAPRETGAGVVPGTPGSIAPEQMLGKNDDPRSDLYSLGVMLCEMLTGQGPFTSPNAMELMLKHLTEPPPRIADIARQRGRPDVPAPVDELVAALLAKDPDQRPASAQATVDWLRSLRAAAVETMPELRMPTPAGATSVGSRLVSLSPSSLPVPALGSPAVGFAARTPVPPAPPTSSSEPMHSAAPEAPARSTQPTNAALPAPPPSKTVEPSPRNRRYLRAAAACLGILATCSVASLWWSWWKADRFSSDPTTQMELEQAADALLDLRLDESEELIRRAQERDPHCAPVALALQAQIYLARDRPLELVDATHAKALRSVETPPALGLKTDTHGFLNAMSRIEEPKVVDRHRDHGGIWSCRQELHHTLFFAARLAVFSVTAGKPAEEMLLQVDPELEHAFTAFSIARARLRRGDFAGARQMIDGSLNRLAPSSPPAMLLDAELLLAEGRADKARARLARLGGGLDWRGRAWHEFLGHRDTPNWYADVERDLDRYLQSDPVLRSDLQVTIADALLSEGRIKEADRLLNKAFKSDAITGARKVTLVALAQIFSMLVYDEQTASAWRNRSTADLLDGVEGEDPSVGRARAYSIAARILIQIVKSPTEKPDLRLLEKTESGISFLVPAVKWYVEVNNRDFPKAIEIASSLPACWKMPYLATTYAAMWQASRPKSTQEQADVMRHLDAVASDEVRERCTNGFHVFSFMQRILLAQALADRATVAAAQGDLARVKDSVDRFDELWPRPDEHLRAVRNIEDARRKLRPETSDSAAPQPNAVAVP